MSYQIEVCVDTIESLHNAISGGATRIELCSCLALGGLTPSFGLMKQAASISSVPVYAMIRPRQGDFLYSSEEVECMLEDIYMAQKCGLHGVVFGALTKHGDIDMLTTSEIIKASKSLGVTFHRAIDLCADYSQALENVIELGCERLLTSGLAPTAFEGKKIITSMVEQASNRISIMAGSGVNARNAVSIIKETQVREIHLSGKEFKPSNMIYRPTSVTMGNQVEDEFLRSVTDIKNIQDVVSAVNSLY